MISSAKIRDTPYTASIAFRISQLIHRIPVPTSGAVLKAVGALGGSTLSSCTNLLPTLYKVFFF